MGKYKGFGLAAASLAATLFFIEVPAGAQVATPSPTTPDAADEGHLQEIVVTAQRKQERLQDVPIAVNVVTAEQLTGRGIVDTQSIAMSVPGLDYGQSGPSAGIIYLRGVGSNDANPNGEPSVATYVDGVYMASPVGNIFDFNSVERVEVLKGPQGTLFGRNATGGVIQVVTRDPKQEPSAEVNVGYGNYRTVTSSFYGTTGITSNLAGDAAVQFSKQYKGWGTNVTTGDPAYYVQSLTYRSKFLFTPGDTTQIRLAIDYGRRNGDTVSYRDGSLRADGTPPPAGNYNTSGFPAVYGYRDGYTDNTQRGVSLHVDQQLGDIKLVSITALRHTAGLYVLDEDTILPEIVSAYLPTVQQSFSQEFQALGKVGRLDWTTGVFLYQNTASYINGILAGAAFGGAITNITGRQRARSASGYAQGTYAITDDTKITGGIRITDEKTRFLSSFDGPEAPPRYKQFDRPTWRLAVDHAFTPDVHTYVSYNRGIKGGGFDLLTPSSTGFNPEILDAYELGFKSELLDRRLRLNISTFLYDYKDIQVQVIPEGSVVTNNAAKARIKGVDADFQLVPLDRLTLSGGFAVLNGHYQNFPDAVGYPASATQGGSFIFNASGKDTIRTPKFTGNVGADYKIPSPVGQFTVSSILSYNDGFYYDSTNRLRQPVYTLLNGTLGWTAVNGRVNASLWGRNLLGKYYYTQGVPSGLGDLLVPAPPRTYGVDFGVKF